jgi:hypothetical protein
MQVHDSYIKQRMRNMGFDPDDCVIKAEPVIFTGATTLISANNVYYFLYEVTEYANMWEIDASNDHMTKMRFILSGKIPSGIYDFTGPIIISSVTSAANIFMFYKVTPGRLLT